MTILSPLRLQSGKVYRGYFMIYGKISSAQLAGGVNSNPPIIGRSIDSTLSGDVDVHNRLNYIEDHVVMPNMDFDDTWGWWAQVQNGHTYKINGQDVPDSGDKRADSIIVHKRALTENYLNLDVSPAIVTQTKVTYNSNAGENFTRMASEYHELIGEGHCIAEKDHSTPNFSSIGATCYNKFKGNVGMCAVIGRIEDVAYTDEELGISANDIKGKTGLGSSKSCAGGFFVTRRSNYSQGRHNASYSIGAETYALNAAEEDGILGTDGYPDNKDFHSFRTWINAIHLVGGGRRPATDGILINGFTTTVPIDSDGNYTSDSSQVSKRVTMHNGFLNGIVIGGSSMAVRHIVKVTNAKGDVLSGYTTDGNSTETVGINTSSWSKLEGKNYGFYLLKHGYSGRILHSRGSALFEAPAFKFLNSKGDMPVVISAGNIKDDNGNIVRGYTPYLLFKTGADRSERPSDISRAKIGYNTTTQYLNTVSDGDIRFVVNGSFSTVANTDDDVDQDPTIPIHAETDAIIYKFQGRSFISSVTASTVSNPLYADLGSAVYKWGNIYAVNGTINTSDRNLKENIVDVTPELMRAWSKVGYKVFNFKGRNRKHIGVIAQDVDEAFKSEGLNARDYGLFCEDTDEQGNVILGIRYSECLALECAYLRYIYSSHSA